MTDVIVIDGGYAGVLAANRLTLRDDVDVTLVSPRPMFVDRVRLHQLVGGSHPAVADFRDVLAARVRLVVDSATRIDARRREVSLERSGTLGYDHLVYAVGSTSPETRVPGASEWSHPIATLESAERLRRILDSTASDAIVTVVGGGPTGIETAAELAEAGRRVALVCGGPLGPYLHPRARRWVHWRLRRLGVEVHDGDGSAVTEVKPDSVGLADGRVLPSAVTVWATGFRVPDLAARSGLSVEPVGRLLTDETLTSVDDGRIVAAGDAAAPSGVPFRMSCQAAVQLGPAAADTVLRRLAGEQPEPNTVGLAAQCISLGRRAGIYQAAHRDDRATRFFLSGRAGALTKEAICRGIAGILAREARRPGAVRFPRWAQDARRRELVRARGETVAG